MREYFKCEDCGAVFDEPGTFTEHIGEPGEWGMDVPYCCCPECGSEDFEEAYDCMECAEYFGKSELNIFQEEVQYGSPGHTERVRLCDKCLEKIKQAIKAGTDEYGIGWELEEMEELGNG